MRSISFNLTGSGIGSLCPTGHVGPANNASGFLFLSEAAAPPVPPAARNASLFPATTAAISAAPCRNSFSRSVPNNEIVKIPFSLHYFRLHSPDPLLLGGGGTDSDARLRASLTKHWDPFPLGFRSL